MATVGVYCLDVGQGDCSFIVPPATEAAPILFDCADAGVARRFVEDHGISKLDAVVVSHLDIDHVRGVLPFMRDFIDGGGAIGALWIAVDRTLKPKKNRAAEALLSQAVAWHKKGAIPIVEPVRERAPKPVAAGTGWSVTALLPRYGDVLGMRLAGGETPNECSVVLRVKHGGQSFLLGGDASLDAWSSVEKAELPAMLIRTSHHGGELGASRGYTLVDLYAEVGASTAAFSVGTLNSFGHPLPAHVASVRRGGACRVLCTQVTSQCEANPRDHVDAARRVASAVVYPYRAWRSGSQEVPCAGTVMATLRDDGTCEVEPSAAAHSALVEAFSSPLCRRP